MISAGIIGGAGYTAGELIRILLHHPEVDLLFVNSNSQGGKALAEVHDDLIGETGLRFTESAHSEVDVLFFCAGHGRTQPFLEAHPVDAQTRIIDLSRDYRLKDPGHSFIYGLPELNRAGIRSATRIANPGCFATCIQLALLPLAHKGLLEEEIHIHATTGSTGAGVKPSPTTHVSWRNNNLSVYKAFSHQHMDEIRQSLHQLQGDYVPPVNFIPLRGDFPRGILASVYLKVDLTESVAREMYADYYEAHPFVVLSDQNPHLKQVVNTNKCILYLKKYEDKLHIISVIDNLVKGASGQAVQNMNLSFGLDESLGLGLKPLAF